MAPGRRMLRPRVSKNETDAVRRSSLQVNLSFVSSLSDSGNGSLRSQLGNHEFTVPDKVQRNRQVDMSVIPETDNSAISNNDGALNVMRTKDQALDQSCQMLKDAILNKTKEMFDQKAELAVKTNSVLKGQRIALKEINNGSKSIQVSKKSVSSTKESTKTSPRSKNILSAKDFRSGKKINNKSLARISKGDTSIILSGSDKSHRQSLQKIDVKVLQVRLTRLSDPKMNVSSESLQSSQSSILEDIGAPMTCSSFISLSRNPESRASQRAESSEDSDEEPVVHSSPKTLTPMEETAVQIPAFSTAKSLTRVKEISKSIEKTKEQNLDGGSPMELTTVQSHIPFCETTRDPKSTRNSVNASTLANASEGSKTNRFSLQVNTSLGTTERSPVQENVGNEKSGMSTISVDGIDDLDKNNTDPMENMSLIARLRNISAKNRQSAENRKSNGGNRQSLGPSFIEGTPYPPSRSVLWRTQLKLDTANPECNDKTSKDSGPGETTTQSSENSNSDSEADYVTPQETVILGDSPCRFTATFGDTQVIPDSSGDEEPAIATTDVKSTKDRSNELRTERSAVEMRNVSTDAVRNNSKNLSMENARSLIVPECLEEDKFPEVASTSVKMANKSHEERRKELSERLLNNLSMGTSKTNQKELSSTDRRSQINPDSTDEDELVEMESTSVIARQQSKEISTQSRMNLSLKNLSLNITKRNTLNIPNENTSINSSRTGRRKLMPLYENLELVSFSPVSPAVSSPKKPFIRKTRKRLQKRKAMRAIAAKRIESMRQDNDDEPGCSYISKIVTQKDKEKTKKPRKIISKKIVVKKIVGMEMMEKLEALRRGGSERESTAGRNSLNEFEKKKTYMISETNTKPRKLVIVTTGFSKGDVDLVKSIVKQLGGAEISSTVSRRTTHVVSTGVRTINLLRGIIRGCWLVSIEWALKSLENNKWINPEVYEMKHFSKAVQENRRDKQLFGKSYVPELFTTCGPIYIEHGTTPPPDILKELIKTAGGRVAENVRDSRLIVGCDGLKEIWILDSITTGDLQPVADYQRN